MRTYYTWQLSYSPDKSYLMAVCGLWTDAELSVGIIVGCFPVMPKFFQHVRPKVYEAFSFWSKSTDTLCQDPKGRSKTSRADGLTQIKNPFAKYKIGLSVLKACDDPYAQLHGDYHTLDVSGASQREAATAFDPIQIPNAGIATRREDLEHGHQNP